MCSDDVIGALQITKSGETTLPFETGGKKPYETLFVAVRKDQSGPAALCETKLMISVPSLWHSSKPPLIGMHPQTNFNVACLF